MAKFSVITINFNNAPGLEKTIKSIISQSFYDFEFIVIDGGSSDGSINLIKKYSDKITYSISEKDNGIYDAQNKGIAVAEGEFCLFLNSGDYFYSNDILEKVFNTGLKPDILYGNIMLEKDGIQRGEKKYPAQLSYHFLLTDNLAHPAQFIKRELFQKFGAYDTTYKIASDYEFFVRLYYKKRISTTHLPFIVSVFDLSGLSAEKKSLTLINAERYAIQRLYFPKLLVLMYHLYGKLLKSEIYKAPFVASLSTFIRNLIFSFIKTGK